jgi:dipeptidyl aminopeptidase/acylaminoacyl peptidase
MDTLYREEKNYFIADFGYRLFWIEPMRKFYLGPKIIPSIIYTHRFGNRPLQRRHPRKWNLRSYALDATGQSVYFTGTKDRRDRLNLYVTRLKTGETTNVSYRDGDYNFVLSNDGQKIAEVFSNQEIAPELYWTDAVPQSKMNRITTRPEAPVPIPECKTPKTGTILNGMTGREIYYRMRLPDGNLVSQKYPVLSTLNSLDCIDNHGNLAPGNPFSVKICVCRLCSGHGRYNAIKDGYEQSGKSPNSDPLSIQLSI